MKELTIEQKAKRYDEAIDVCRKLYNDAKANGYTSDIEDYEQIFPELKESEDEKIRKELIEFVKSRGGFKQEYIAWLEKQCEQQDHSKFLDSIQIGDQVTRNEDGVLVNLSQLKRVAKTEDKVEPKFHEGDWVMLDSRPVFITKVEDMPYNTHQYWTSDGTWFGDATNAKLWTIQDAKAGDVFHSTGRHNDCIFIFNGLDNWKFDEPNGDRAVATGYCCLFVSADKMEFGTQGPDCVEVNTVKPATKIQRDILFQKMKEAGYEFDFDKLELKKIEQNPAWSEEDEEMWLSAIEYVLTYPAHTNSVVDWLKSLKDRVQPQQEWSEEDKNRFTNLISFIKYSNKSNATKACFIEFINKLKSLKDIA